MIGLLLSVYALYVENKVENSPGFVAFCDINAWIACSKVSELCVAVPKTKTLMTSLPLQVFQSEYGHLLRMWGVVEAGSPLDVPNAALGVLFYSAAFLHDVLTFIPGRKLLMAVASIPAGVWQHVMLVHCNPLLTLCLFFSVWLLAPQLLCIYLGWVLATILKDMCVVCTSTYFVNAYIVYKAWRNFLATGASSDKKTK